MLSFFRTYLNVHAQITLGFFKIAPLRAEIMRCCGILLCLNNHHMFLVALQFLRSEETLNLKLKMDNNGA